MDLLSNFQLYAMSLINGVFTCIKRQHSYLQSQVYRVHLFIVTTLSFNIHRRSCIVVDIIGYTWEIRNIAGTFDSAIYGKETLILNSYYKAIVLTYSQTPLYRSPI